MSVSSVTHVSAALEARVGDELRAEAGGAAPSEAAGAGAASRRRLPTTLWEESTPLGLLMASYNSLGTVNTTGAVNGCFSLLFDIR